MWAKWSACVREWTCLPANARNATDPVLSMINQSVPEFSHKQFDWSALKRHKREKIKKSQTPMSPSWQHCNQNPFCLWAGTENKQKCSCFPRSLGMGSSTFGCTDVVYYDVVLIKWHTMQWFMSGSYNPTPTIYLLQTPSYLSAKWWGERATVQ